MAARRSRVLDRHRGFQNIGLPNPVFTVENSADNNPIHTTHSKSVHTTCMVSNPGFHIVVTIAEHACCDHGLKTVLKPSSYRLQIFRVKYEYLRSLQLCEYQFVRGKPKKRVCNDALATLTTYM